MVNRFVPAKGLDERVARTHLLPEIERLKSLVASEAQTRAPEGKVWMTARDERVRKSHRHADAQEIPANLRYVLPKANDEPGTDLAVAPRDPNLPIANAINCRCESVPLPGAIARKITEGQTIITGTRVTARVECAYHRIVESEFGSDGDPGAHFMGGAVDAVAAASRATNARRT